MNIVLAIAGWLTIGTGVVWLERRLYGNVHAEMRWVVCLLWPAVLAGILIHQAVTGFDKLLNHTTEGAGKKHEAAQQREQFLMAMQQEREAELKEAIRLLDLEMAEINRQKTSVIMKRKMHPAHASTMVIGALYSQEQGNK